MPSLFSDVTARHPEQRINSHPRPLDKSRESDPIGMKWDDRDREEEEGRRATMVVMVMTAMTMTNDDE